MPRRGSPDRWQRRSRRSHRRTRCGRLGCIFGVVHLDLLFALNGVVIDVGVVIEVELAAGALVDLDLADLTAAAVGAGKLLLGEEAVSSKLRAALTAACLACLNPSSVRRTVPSLLRMSSNRSGAPNALTDSPSRGPCPSTGPTWSPAPESRWQPPGRSLPPCSSPRRCPFGPSVSCSW